MAVWHNVTLQSLRKHVVHTYRRGGGSRPDVLLIDLGGQRAVLKDHNACDRGFRLFIGPLLARREARALVRLETVRGVPRLYASPDRRSVLTEHLPCARFGDRTDATAWEDFFERFESLLEDIHSLGVAHCDLRNPGNVLVCERNQPAIIDFVSCVFRGQKWNPVSRWIFDRFSQADRDALSKLKKRVAPELLTPHEERVLSTRTMLQKVARIIGRSVRRVSRWLFTSRT